MKLIMHGIGLLEFFDPLCRVWWFGKNETIMDGMLDRDVWFMGLVFTRRYVFESREEAKRETNRVVWGI